MFVSSCPHCGDSITVPSRARTTSRVRCPLCTAEFTLEEMLAKLPPLVELLDEPEEHFISAGSATGHAAVGGHTDGNVATLAPGAADAEVGELGLAAAEERAEKPAYAFDGGATADTTTRKPISATPRPKKKGKNPAIEGLKIMLGGAAAIPVALAIFWYGVGTDPFEAGPTVAKYAPWAVPQKFHGTKEGAKKSDDKEAAPKTNKPKKESRIEGLPKVESTEIPSLELGPTVPENEKKDPGLGPMIDPPGGLEIDPLTPPPADKKANTSDKAGTGGEQPGTGGNPDQPKVMLAVANAPKYSGPEIGEAVSNATKALQAWKEGSAAAEVEEKTKLARALYKSLAELSEKVTFADRDDLGLTEQIQATRELATKLQASDSVVALISRVGPAWATKLAADTRGSNGVVLIGTLQKPSAAAEGSARNFNLEDEDHTLVPLVVDRAQPEVRVLILGVIVEEPGLAMPGFVGDEERVVFGDFALPFPAK